MNTLDDLIDMARRRARPLAIMAMVGCVFSMLFALSQPRIYQSTEILQIAAPLGGNDPANPLRSDPPGHQLQMIEQRLTTRSTLLEVINAYTLFAEVPDLRPDEMVTRLRHAVRFQADGHMLDGIARDNRLSFLSISAQMSNPMQARQVAHEFAQRAIRLSQVARIEQVQSSVVFFTAQEDRLQSEIATLQDQAITLRARHDLPAEREVDLRRSEIATLNVALLGLDREFLAITHKANQVTRTVRPALAKRNLADFNEQLATLNLQRDLLRDRKTQAEHSLVIPNEVERELDVYARKHKLLGVEVDAITAQRIQAEVGLHLVHKTLADSVVVIEPATIPVTPITGSRTRIALIGMGLSLLLTFALALVLERLNPVIRTPRQMQRRVGYAPIVSIPFLDPVPPKVTGWQRYMAWLNGPGPSDGSTA